MACIWPIGVTGYSMLDSPEKSFSDHESTGYGIDVAADRHEWKPNSAARWL